MRRIHRLAWPAAALSLFSTVIAQADPPAHLFKDEMRLPWQRSDENFLRSWLVLGPLHCDLPTDCLKAGGGEAGATPVDGLEFKSAGGTSLKWHPQKSWGDEIDIGDFPSPGGGGAVYAFTKIARAADGKALLSVASEDGIRVWVNGRQVLAKDGHRSLTPDEDQTEIDLDAGDNNLLIKADAGAAFTARVLERGARTARLKEIGPSIIEIQPDIFTVRTDVDAARADADPVKVEVVRPGGGVAFESDARRGDLVLVPIKTWTDGPYEVRLTTRTAAGLLYVTQLPFFKGNSLVTARELAAEAAHADVSQPAGFTLRMLAEMVEDRLGVKLADATGNPWPKIHSPLMEFAELMLEKRGETGRIRAGGFVRLAWRDEVDGSPQYCRAYLPASYDKSKRWPLVLNLHGTNGENPVYVRWWAADSRASGVDTEFSGHRQIIYIEPHGRNNVMYLGIGDSDIVRCLAEAKRLLAVDEDRVYLMGNSMGGFGTWNVGSRHPDLFAALGPIFGGTDYHLQMTEEQLAALTPIERYLGERQSSWSMAEGLLNVPVFVRQGDMDQSVNPDWSRWGVKLLQRWGYDARYREFPGRSHEAFDRSSESQNIEWFLEHQREPNPRQVRIRSTELRNAKAYWVDVLQAASPIEFMVVDAQIVDRNVIRLDTQNVLDVSLSPAAALIDPARPLKVVWNGVAHEMHLVNGVANLSDPAYRPARLHKTAALPGGTQDFYLTPFAVVIGTTSKDAQMNELCRDKAQAFIDRWRDSQKQEPRVFLDSEIGEADIARYSLVLFGGPGENAVSTKFAGQIPLRIARDAVVIDGRTFKTQDAAVQMLYPNPRNPQRYVWIVAGTSLDGMYNSDANFMRQDEWDYVIDDGRIPAFKVVASRQKTRVAQGMFDYNWRYAGALNIDGDAAIRAQGRVFRRPNKDLRVDPKLLDEYAGRYQLKPGPLIEIVREGAALVVKGDFGRDELVPTGQTAFLDTRFGVRMEFVRDAAGKISGFAGYQNGDFEGVRIE